MHMLVLSCFRVFFFSSFFVDSREVTTAALLSSTVAAGPVFVLRTIYSVIFFSIAGKSGNNKLN